ncbi:D-serine/D-alanine/glycine transporter OS=Rhodanobacter lindaniclasticus OX=75310 GN=B1991_01055 PE=4 SV=1 [Rhodanobacter lindaniclasticus]
MTALPDQPDHLRRSLSNRHLQLIAVGGAIGTGLFISRARRSAWLGRRYLLQSM